MKLLAIDTATEGCSSALLVDGQVRERFFELERGHSERILVMVDELLAEGGIALERLDAIGFGRGPGAFTGVRLAAAVTQGLAWGASLPVVPVSDLRAVAQQVLDVAPDAQAVLVCNDARMQEVYWAWFARAEDGLARSASDEHVGAPERVVQPDELAVARLHAAGRGFRAYPALARNWESKLAGLHPELLPRAGAIARLAATEFRAGRALPAEQALPVYLRDDVAQPQRRD